MRSFKFFVKILIVFIILVYTPNVFAKKLSRATIAKAEAYVGRAKLRFKAGQYKEAANLFWEAHTLTKKLDPLFNAARAYEEFGSYTIAIFTFNNYIALQKKAKNGGDIEGIKAAERRIASIKKKMELIKQKEQAAIASKKAAEALRIKQAKKAKAAKLFKIKQKQQQKLALKKTLKDGNVDVLTYSLYGVSALLIGGGTYGVINAHSQAKNLKAMKLDDPGEDKYYLTEIDNAMTQERVTIGIIVVGGAVFTWATYRLLFKKDDTPSGLTFVPVVSQQNSGFVLTFNF